MRLSDLREAMPTYRFETSCIDAKGDDIHDMQEQAEDVPAKTLYDHVGREAVAEIFPDYDWSSRPRDLTLDKDWAVRFCRSVYQGRPCFYIEHSRIEYIFVPA